MPLTFKDKLECLITRDIKYFCKQIPSIEVTIRVDSNNLRITLEDNGVHLVSLKSNHM